MFDYRNVKAINNFAKVRAEFTPDIATLELQQFHTVFVCDDLMHAGRNHHIIGDYSAYEGRGFTSHGYTFYKKRTDGSPVVLAAKQAENKFDFSCLKIKGEIYTVETNGILKLDSHYQNRLQYRRKRIKILYPTRQHGQVVNKDSTGRPLPSALQGHKHFLLPERVDMVSAWMYIGVSDYWNNLLDGGFAFEPVRIIEPKEEKAWLIKYYSWKNQP